MLAADLSKKILQSLDHCLQTLAAQNPAIQNSENIKPDLEFVLALSGGLDSVVLLDLLSSALPALSISAVYIDHQLQADSQSWMEFTKELCSKYNIPYNSYQVKIVKSKSQSTEALAREARYSKFAELIDVPHKILLTAQHLNDQAETFLLQLLRSAGPRGLAAMPQLKKFAKGYHCRPLLGISREDLASYAEAKKLIWVNDKTNLDLKFDRNYLRHQIIPLMSERWPNIVKNIAQSAKNCAEHENLLNSYLSEDYNQIVSIEGDGALHATKAIDAAKLAACSLEKQTALLRYWLRDNHAQMPERKIIEQIITNCIQAKAHKNPEVAYGQYLIKRYKNKLYFFTSENVFLDNQTNQIQSHINSWNYQLGDTLEIPELGVKITSQKYCSVKDGTQTHLALCISPKAQLIIKFRTGGERCRPVGRGGSVSVKKLLQEASIPQWQRSKVPLLYVDHKLACVVGFKVCEGFSMHDQTSSSDIWLVNCQYVT